LHHEEEASEVETIASGSEVTSPATASIATLTSTTLASTVTSDAEGASRAVASSPVVPPSSEARGTHCAVPPLSLQTKPLGHPGGEEQSLAGPPPPLPLAITHWPPLHEYPYPQSLSVPHDHGMHMPEYEGSGQS
jgi:hypothetical protein